MNTIGDILSSSKAEVKKEDSRHLQHEWQAFAYKVWKDYCGIPKELPNMIRFHKQYQGRRDLLDGAYNFCVDYQGAIPKYKMFYWHFWRRYKNLPLAFGS